MKELGWSQLVPSQMPGLCPCWSLGRAVLSIHTSCRSRCVSPPATAAPHSQPPRQEQGTGGCPWEHPALGRGKNRPWAGSSPLWLPAIYSPSRGGGKRRQELAWFALTLSPPAEKVPEGPCLPPPPSLDGAGSWGRGLDPHPGGWKRGNCWSGRGFSVPFLTRCVLGRDRDSVLPGRRQSLCCGSQNPGQAPMRRWQKEEESCRGELGLQEKEL